MDKEQNNIKEKVKEINKQMWDKFNQMDKQITDDLVAALKDPNYDCFGKYCPQIESDSE